MKLAELPVHRVSRKISAEQATEMIGSTVPYLDATISEAGIYIDEDTDEPFLAYFPMIEEVNLLRRSVLNIKYGQTARARLGFMNESRTFGMAPRKEFQRKNSCRVTQLAIEQPEEHAVLVAFASKFAALYKEFAPEQFAQDTEVINNSGITAEWRMTDDALWTSGNINKSSQLPYHRDGFNFETWSAMPVVRRNMEGGYLHFPEYDAVVSCRDGWVLFFPGYKYLHGVTPMQARDEAKESYRYTVVYYALRGMKDCFTYAIETARGQANRTGREDHMSKVITGEAESRVTVPKKR